MGTSQVIYIRTDGNKDIAAGHIMRCLTIAREIITLGHSVCFLVSDTDSLDILSSNESSIHLLENTESLTENISGAKIYALMLPNAEYRNLESELPELKCLLQTRPGTLLIDSYFITDTYLKELRTITKTAYIDDIRAFEYTTDLLINYDCFSEEMCAEYKQGIYKHVGTLLLGVMYSPLRPHFFTHKIDITQDAKNILVTTGSSDPYHFTLQFCNRLVDNPNLSVYQYHIVIGSLNTDFEALKVLTKDFPSIHLHTGLTDLMPLMLTCDLAITAGGTTLYELSALGIPSFSFSMADNQISNVTIMDELNAIPYCGDIRTDMDGVLTRTFSFIHDYALDFAKRKAVHTKMNSLINGDGAKRIADALLKL